MTLAGQLLAIVIVGGLLVVALWFEERGGPRP